MEQLSICLWFDGQAEEAMNHYTSIFKNSKKGKVSYYGEGAPAPKGSVMTATFELNGMKIMALNAGPKFKFNMAVSLVASCKDQEEIDYYWEKLGEGGRPSVCGWLEDKFGLAWQIVPAKMGEIMSNTDPEKAKKAMQAMMGMTKLNIKELEDAQQ